jgi:antitoxin (DNA-binding transcriptional repressor) of toxin-antitoxin stability system
MQMYTVAEVREKLAAALDLAAVGQEVIIVRRGQRFALTKINVKMESSSPSIAAIDSSLLDDWHWQQRPSGRLVLKTAVRKTKRSTKSR